MPVISPPQGVGSVDTAAIKDATITAADLGISVPQFASLSGDATAVVGVNYADAASGLNIAVTNAVPTRFMYFIQWVANATTTGGRFSLNGPAHTRLTYTVRWNTTATVVTLGPLGTGYDQAFTVGTDSDAAENFAVIEGIIVPSASGTLALRTAAEVANPGAITVKAGSSVLYW